MARYLDVHPQNPQERLIRQAVGVLADGGLVAYPTDSGYALGCALENAAGRDATAPLRARKGRASYLGPRSVGHLDPGAASVALLFGSAAATLGGSR